MDQAIVIAQFLRIFLQHYPKYKAAKKLPLMVTDSNRTDALSDHFHNICGMKTY